MSTITLSPAIVTHDWPLWTVEARLAVTDPSALDEARAITDDLCAEVDRLASRFRDDSLVRQLESTGADRLRVPPTFVALVREALAAAELTDGDVDPTLGQALRRSGYDQHVAGLPGPSTGPRFTVTATGPAWRQVHLDGDLLTMPPGILLDLGATAKALTADWAARTAAAQLGCGVMVSLGGDIATAGTGPQGGWQVLVDDGPGNPNQTITLHDGWAVATSSTQHRRWTASGQAAHHILDPRTLTPTPVAWRTVSVVAPSCALANTLATASIVRGRRALRWIATHDVAARLVDVQGRVHRVGDWPA